MKITMEAVTPLWSGDAWGRCNTEFRPSTLLGSLRYWLKVICHAANLPVWENDEILDYEQFNKDVWESIHKYENKSIDLIKINAAAKQLSIPSLIFGCTGWKGLIQIEQINNKENNGWDLNKVIYKKNNIWDICKSSEWKKTIQKAKEANERINGWFLRASQIRKVEIGFNVYPDIVKDEILVPLLDFIQKYGYIGAKNNIGFGRVCFNELNNSSPCINFSISNKGKVYFTEIIDENIQQFEDLLNCNKIGLYKTGKNEKNLENAIFNLIQIKTAERRKVKSVSKRHSLFGYVDMNKNTKKDDDKTEGTKIIPWINRNGKGYETGFVSVAFLNNRQR